MSRRPLSRGECEGLDGYMRRLGLGEGGVLHAYDLKVLLNIMMMIIIMIIMVIIIVIIIIK